jgi:hypothetical protein
MCYKRGDQQKNFEMYFFDFFIFFFKPGESNEGNKRVWVFAVTLYSYSIVLQKILLILLPILLLHQRSDLLLTFAVLVADVVFVLVFVCVITSVVVMTLGVVCLLVCVSYCVVVFAEPVT